VKGLSTFLLKIGYCRKGSSQAKILQVPSIILERELALKSYCGAEKWVYGNVVGNESKKSLDRSFPVKRRQTTENKQPLG
jgi:hypothetical protein